MCVQWAIGIHGGFSSTTLPRDRNLRMLKSAWGCSNLLVGHACFQGLLLPEGLPDMIESHLWFVSAMTSHIQEAHWGTGLASMDKEGPLYLVFLPFYLPYSVFSCHNERFFKLCAWIGCTWRKTIWIDNQKCNKATWVSIRLLSYEGNSRDRE